MKECVFCEAILNESEVHNFDGLDMCGGCYVAETLKCADCGKRIWKEDVEGNGEIKLCFECYDKNYVYCYRCEKLLHKRDAKYGDNEDTPFCGACFEE